MKGCRGGVHMVVRSHSSEESLAVALTLESSYCGTIRKVQTFGRASWRCLLMKEDNPLLLVRRPHAVTRSVCSRADRWRGFARRAHERSI